MQGIVWTRSSIFIIWWTSIYTQNLSVCNSCQYIYITGFCKFFFVLQDLIDWINAYFQRIDFQRTFLLIGFQHATSQFFPDENRQPLWEWHCINLWVSNLVSIAMSIKYENLHSFKNVVILLCHSILETRISHLPGSAHFTISLIPSFFSKTGLAESWLVWKNLFCHFWPNLDPHFGPKRPK